MRFSETLLERGSRTQTQVARILGVTRQAVEYSQNPARQNQRLGTKILYRVLINASDDFIAYMLDDDNFDTHQRHKHAIDAELEYRNELPPTPEHTYGELRLKERLRQLKPNESVAFQHHKMLCEVKRFVTGGIDYFCGYVYLNTFTEQASQVIERNFMRDITYQDPKQKCIGFDLAELADQHAKRTLDIDYLVVVLQDLIRVAKIYGGTK